MGIVGREIYPSSRLLASTIGVSVQPNKAIVGDNAFAHEAGIHQDGVLKAAITYEIMTPQSIGRPSNELVLGKHSGRHAFRERLAELGFELEGEAFQEAFRRFKELADAKKVIFNEDLEAIVQDAVVQTDERFRLVQCTVLSGTFAKPSATVELQIDGELRKATALGHRPGGRGLQGDRGADRDQERPGALPGERGHRRHGRPGRGLGDGRGRRAQGDRQRAPTPTSWWPAARPTSTP